MRTTPRRGRGLCVAAIAVVLPAVAPAPLRTEPTLGRISFWVPPGQMEGFERVCLQDMRPILDPEVLAIEGALPTQAEVALSCHADQQTLAIKETTASPSTAAERSPGIPVEVTRLGSGSFMEAWELGAKACQSLAAWRPRAQSP